MPIYCHLICRPSGKVMPGNANAIPNGFYGEEACQLMRYAGMSDKISSIGFSK
ncbi:MAG: hypothetical protein U0Z17_01300 [Bacteroidales bacterium]